MKQKYDEATVIRSLVAKKCVVDTHNKVISVPKGVLGNGSWGKVDFLCHYKGYVQVWINQGNPVKDEDDSKLITKFRKKKDDDDIKKVSLKKLNLRKISL